MNRARFENCATVITGASSGIGAALAWQFAKAGAKTAIVARRQDRLDQFAEEIAAAGHTRPLVICADLFEPDAATLAVEQARAALGQIDVLVNNAGLGYAGAFASHGPEQIEQMLQLNVRALVRLTELVLPEMLERGRGWIMNVASTASYQPMPYLATYAATKAFVASFSEALWAELRKRGVVVTCLNPGTTRTEFFDHHSWSRARELFVKRAMSPERVAEIGIKALAKGRPSVVCGWGNRVLAAVGGTLPSSWVARGLARVLRSGG
jgi:short-subunit dehydrogenase